MIDLDKLKGFHTQLVDALTDKDEGRFSQLLDSAVNADFNRDALALVAREAMIGRDDIGDHLLTLEVYRLALGVVVPVEDEGLERTPDPEPRRRAKGWRETIGEPRERKPDGRKRKPYVPSNGLWNDERINAF